MILEENLEKKEHPKIGSSIGWFVCLMRKRNKPWENVWESLISFAWSCFSPLSSAATALSNQIYLCRTLLCEKIPSKSWIIKIKFKERAIHGQWEQRKKKCFHYKKAEERKGSDDKINLIVQSSWLNIFFASQWQNRGRERKTKKE